MVKLNHEIGRNLFTKWLKRYISSSIFYLNSQVYDEGNTLLHLLCAKGDSHVYVLAELLSMKDRNNAPYFDINQHNDRQGRNVLTFRCDVPVVFYKLNTKYICQSKHNKNYCIMFYNMFYNYMFRPFSLDHLQVVYTRP